MERTGIYPAAVEEQRISREELLRDHEHKFECWSREPADPHAAFLVDCCRKDAAKGFGEPLTTAEDLDTRFGRGGWCSNPRFSVAQSSGKVRPIDDGKRSGVNDATSFVESLVLCSPLQPCVCARLIAEEAAAIGSDAEVMRLEVGGEDLPDAFRHIPVAPADYCCNIVAVQEPSNGTWLFQLMFGHLFGHACAVINFNRYSRLLEGAARRLCALLVSSYYDDFNIVDLASARGTGQCTLGALAAAMGTPFAVDKQQRMSVDGDFLGIVQAIGSAHQGIVRVRPRARLVADVLGMVELAVQTDRLTPGTAGKLLGKISFASSALYGRLGRAAVRPLVQRMYADSHPWTLSHTLLRALDYLGIIFRSLPEREILVKPPRRAVIVVASDAQADGRRPSAGLLALGGPAHLRVGLFGPIQEDILEAWGYPHTRRQQGGNPIALCEGAAVLFGIAQLAGELAGQCVVWFIDNTSSLHSLVKGTSTNAMLSRIVEVVHILLHRHRINVWFEFVSSSDNWADGISRHGFQDEFVQRLQLKCSPLRQSAWWWSVALSEIWEGSMPPCMERRM